MSTIKISELADRTITLESFLALAGNDGVAFKGTVKELQEFISTLAVLGLKAAISAADAAPTEDGLFPCEDTGTYTDFGGLVVDVSNTITFISVSGTQTVFKKVEIPVTITIDATAVDGSTNAIQSNAVFDIKTILETTSNTQEIFLNSQNEKFYSNFNGSTSVVDLGTDYILENDGDYIEFTGKANALTPSYQAIGVFGTSATGSNILGWQSITKIWLREDNGTWRYFTITNNPTAFHKVKLEVINAGTQWQLSIDGVITDTLTKSSSFKINRIGKTYSLFADVDLKEIKIHNSTQDFNVLQASYLSNTVDIVLNEISEDIAEVYYDYNPTGYNSNTRALWKIYVKIKGSKNSFIGYWVVNDFNNDSLVNKDVFRILFAYEYEFSGDTMAQGVNIALADQESEFTYRRSGKDDYTGGIHGDEIYTSIDFFVNNIRLTNLSSSIELTACDQFRYIQKSNLYTAPTGGVIDRTVEFTHFKETSFLNNGFSCSNLVIATINMNDISIFYGSIAAIGTAFSEFAIDDNYDESALDSSGGNVLESTRKSMKMWSETNKLGVSITSDSSLNNTTCKQSIANESSSHKYYRDLAKTDVTGDLSVNIGDVIRTSTIVTFYKN